MMYQFLGISLCLPYRPFQRFKAESHNLVNTPKVETKKDNRDQYHNRSAPHFCARRPGSLAHLELYRLIKLPDASEEREFPQPWRPFVAAFSTAAANRLFAQ